MQIANCKMQIENGNPTISRWPHRWAVLLACATFPLLWVGGLVTTTDAGMAVPDWPSTYGYNLFLYPWQTWLSGPWDIFVEHGHRLLGATVGLITIALLATLWRAEHRAWVRWLGACALVLVVFQGVLGGMRVLFDERTLAMLHGVTGPLFFALSVALVCVTSLRWRDADPSTDEARYSPVRSLALVTCILVYLQIVLGAVLRHVPIETEPATFAMAVRFHLFLAAILSLHVVLLVISILRRARPLAGFAWTLVALLLVQISLGAGTWIVKFAVPTWAPQWVSLGNAAVQDGGWLQTHVITAHVAVGSLLLVTSLALALFAVRLLPTTSTVRDRPVGNGRLEAAV
jgi:cytochrome c oxidase assembly protein subunit 15